MTPLVACEPSRSFERSVDGTITYIDDLSEEEKAEARKFIIEGLERGLETYGLGVGDALEILFSFRREPTVEAYSIAVGDTISIEVLHNPEFNRTVKVQPDGRIPTIFGRAVTAVGLTTDQLTEIAKKEYRNILPDPIITVSVTDTHTPLDEFAQLISSEQSKRSRRITVGPDGSVSLPLLPPIQALGLSLEELQDSIDAAYSAIGLPVSVSVLPSSIGADRVFVFGEVPTSGAVASPQPQTVLMAIASAGGVLPSGSMQAVKLFYVDDEQNPRVRSVNLHNVLYKLQLEEDMIVPDNSVIYVPPTRLAKAGRLVDQVLKDILMFNGFSAGINASYIINSDDSSGTIVTTTP